MHSSRYNREQDTHEPHPWLQEKVYKPLRQRTIELVRNAVDTLLKDKQRISLATVAARSKEVDPEHRGVARSCHFRQPGGQGVLRTAPDLAEPSPQARKSGCGKFTSPTRTDQS